jgi:hypothetical protein
MVRFAPKCIAVEMTDADRNRNREGTATLTFVGYARSPGAQA